MPLPTPDTNVEYLEFPRYAYPCLAPGRRWMYKVRHRGVQRAGSMPLGWSKLRPRPRSMSRILRALSVFLRLRLSTTYFGRRQPGTLGLQFGITQIRPGR
jgi:hypothetical protein